MESLHETEVDGVRCFWADAHRPTLTARLLFRQGMADESLVDSGWLHLVEHLCLHGRGGGVLDVNGSVSLLDTAFDGQGPSAVVAEHLSGVAAWLARPFFGELDRERGVLRAEARLRGGAITRALAWRYGAQGPGLAAYDEPGLAMATPAALTERVNRVFTAENAILALNGPPPAGLRLPLPHGSFLPPVPASPCELSMGMYVDEAGLTVSGLVERSEAATWVAEIVQRALRQRLRDELGGAYSPFAHYERVDARSAVVIGGSDVLPEVLPHLAGRVLHLVGQMASEPVPTPWIEEMRAARLQALADPDAAGWQSFRAASVAIVGDQPDDLATIIDATRGVDAEQVRTELIRFCDSLLVGLPGATSWSDQLPAIRFPRARQAPTGAAFRSANWPADRVLMHIADDRVTLSESTDVLELRIPDLAGMYCFPDGGRQLVGRDGWTLHIEPTHWRNGRQVTSALDDAVPSSLHLPQQARDLRPFTPSPWISRWWKYLRSGRYFWTVLVIILAPVAITALAIGAGHLPESTLAQLGRGIPAILFLAAVVSITSAHKRRPQPAQTREADTGRVPALGEDLDRHPGPTAAQEPEPRA